jgi:hypothetical protein
LRRRGALLAFGLATALLCTRTAAQTGDSGLYVREAGSGAAAEALEDALRKPFVLLHEPWNTPLYEGRVYDRSVVVLNSDASVAATVHGDVVVINGSLHLMPTAHIDGRALAFGGNVYDAAGAVVGARRDAFPATRYDTVRTRRGLALVYHEPPAPEYDLVNLPGLYGVRVPTYDRVDGLSIGWNPELVFGDSTLVVSPSVMYRSNLGQFDAAATLTARKGGAFARFTAAQDTRSNDGWIQTDIANSVMVLCCGKDFRNYWRAELFEGRAGYRWADSARHVEVWAGARSELASSVAAGGPWSISGQTSSYSMYRSNPAVDDGRIESWLAGIDGGMTGALTLDASLQVEVPYESPGSRQYSQFTADLDATLATNRDQELELRLHGIYTSGDTAHAQRFGYLGSSGTVLTLELLSQGGDQLFFAETDYTFTFSGIDIPYSTPPSFALAYTAGAAGIQRLPRITQNVGARLEVKPFRADAFVDPANGQWRVVVLFWFVR